VAALGGISVGGIGPRITRRAGPWRSLLAAGTVMAATQAWLGLTANVIAAAMLLFASSAAWALFNMTSVTMRQRQVPARLLGRVTSLYGTVAGGSEALGALGGGAPMLIGAAPIAATVILLGWRHRSHGGPAPTSPCD
jgi:hypothetical protein